MSDEIEVTAKLELALLQAMRAAYQASGTSLAGVPLFAAQQGGIIDDGDRLIFSALNPDDELAHAGIYDVEVSVVKFTKSTTPEGRTDQKSTPHQKQVAELAAIFDDPNHDALVTLLNQYAGIGVSCFQRDGKDERGKSDDGSCWVWRRKLIVTCHLADAPTFDSTDVTFDSDTVTFDAVP